jgi:hypothetical protein
VTVPRARLRGLPHFYRHRPSDLARENGREIRKTGSGRSSCTPGSDADAVAGVARLARSTIDDDVERAARRTRERLKRHEAELPAADRDAIYEYSGGVTTRIEAV